METEGTGIAGELHTAPGKAWLDAGCAFLGEMGPLGSTFALFLLGS